MGELLLVDSLLGNIIILALAFFGLMTGIVQLLKLRQVGKNKDADTEKTFVEAMSALTNPLLGQNEHFFADMLKKQDRTNKLLEVMARSSLKTSDALAMIGEDTKKVLHINKHIARSQRDGDIATHSKLDNMLTIIEELKTAVEVYGNGNSEVVAKLYEIMAKLEEAFIKNMGEFQRGAIYGA